MHGNIPELLDFFVRYCPTIRCYFLDYGSYKISKVRLVFTMQYFLFRCKNVPVSCNVSKRFIKEMHVDIVLSLKLLFHQFPSSQFGHINLHMAVNVLIFVVFLTTCPMTYQDKNLWRDGNFSAFAFEYFNRHSNIVTEKLQISGCHHHYLNCPWKKKYCKHLCWDLIRP